MARRQVIEIICDRCGKMENQAPDSPKEEGKAEFKVFFEGKKVAFDDLCERCRKALRNYVEKIARESKDDDQEKPEEDKPRSGLLSRVTG